LRKRELVGENEYIKSKLSTRSQITCGCSYVERSFIRLFIAYIQKEETKEQKFTDLKYND
jgi:hypothetical protein